MQTGFSKTDLLVSNNFNIKKKERKKAKYGHMTLKKMCNLIFFFWLKVRPLLEIRSTMHTRVTIFTRFLIDFLFFLLALFEMGKSIL